MGHIIALQDIQTNFRRIQFGGIAPGVLYRSEHPVPDGKPDKQVITQAQAARINCVINLHDDAEGLRLCAAASPWYDSLFARGNVIGLNLDFNFASPSFAKKIRRALEFMLVHDGPYLIHCWAGVDRTGFLSALLEALMGASLREIVKDYRYSFVIGGSSAVFSGNASDAGTEILRQLMALNKEVPLSDETLQATAERYLVEDIGMGVKKTAALKRRLGAILP